MVKLERNPLGLSRAGIVMLVWGVLVLGAGLYNQWNFPSVEGVLLLWGGVTVLGLAVQGVCELKDQPVNYFIWAGAIAAGWAFTLYTAYSNPSFYVYLPGAWLIALGLAYVPTARQIDTKFWYFAAAHLVIGAVMILAAQGIVKIDFLVRYGSLMLGIVGGGLLILAAFMARVPRVITQA